MFAPILVAVVLMASPTFAEAAGSGDDASSDTCVVTVDSPQDTFDDLQDAIDEANDGATITVRGVCSESVKIYKRHDLRIHGVPPDSGCSPYGPAQDDLTSTVTGGSREVIKVRKSKDIDIRYLKIVDGKREGVEIENSRRTTLACNCVAHNHDEGVELEESDDNTIEQNLVTMNGYDGIKLNECKENTIRANTVDENEDDGLAIEDDSHENGVTCNRIRRNAEDGIDVDYSDENEIKANEVVDNGRRPGEDNGIELRKSDKNFVDSNQITGNADGLVDQVKCQSGSDGNSGSNVVPPCGTTTAAVPIDCALATGCGNGLLCYFVSTKGKQGNTGTPSSPFGSFEDARDAIRRHKESSALPAHGAIVYIGEGIYPRDRSLELGPEDSGEPGAPVIWRNIPGEEVRIIGAKLLPDLLQVTDPAALARIQDAHESQILQADLTELDLPPGPPPVWDPAISSALASISSSTTCR